MKIILLTLIFISSIAVLPIIMVLKSTPLLSNRDAVPHMLPVDMPAPAPRTPPIVPSILNTQVVYPMEDFPSPSYRNKIVFAVEDNGWNEYIGGPWAVSCAVIPQGEISIDDAISMYAICKLGATIN